MVALPNLNFRGSLLLVPPLHLEQVRGASALQSCTRLLEDRSRPFGLHETLRRWKRTVSGRRRLERWSRALVDVALPLVFLLGFPRLVGLLVRTDVTWAGLLVFPVPEAALWLIASALLTLVRGVGKTILLARPAEAPSLLAG